jgi:hypothetical protein
MMAQVASLEIYISGGAKEPHAARTDILRDGPHEHGGSKNSHPLLQGRYLGIYGPGVLRASVFYERSVFRSEHRPIFKARGRGEMLSNSR